MRCEHAIRGRRTEPPLSPEEESKFCEADNLLKLSLISVIDEGMVPLYMDMPTGKDMWDALQAKFGVRDAGSELYLMEQFYDYKMVDDRSVVEQAHEIQMLAKELENNKCVLPHKFVADGIIAKLPPTWRDFATSLKHRRQEFSVTDLVASLSVEENARAKDTRGKKVQTEGGTSANLVQRRDPQSFRNRKNKNKNPNVRPQPQAFKKKANKEKKGGCCFVCGSTDHWAKECPDRKDKQQKKTANIVVSEAGGSGYGRTRCLPADGKRYTCGCSWCWYGQSEVYFGEDRAAEERAACPFHKEESRQRVPNV
ncbi:uncharacterized protein LOC110437193 [Sorghum bicolor]|uniref:uncharacterized protein LOC110437193 n=1 Tax=Sorghum bicolor TaxID=4558 RepID=UPI000B426B03|nr:uncharacterized protein LOC110437193 [Sorghum bicolor]|eukprot:XP_021321217.1 uncharacterized protein LOC110437193 [Sorghum bicolor]